MVFSHPPNIPDRLDCVSDPDLPPNIVESSDECE